MRSSAVKVYGVWYGVVWYGMVVLGSRLASSCLDTSPFSSMVSGSSSYVVVFFEVHLKNAGSGNNTPGWLVTNRIQIRIESGLMNHDQ
eukprot:scaffold4494_cov161-Amphora_coffeaeformis.AAC.2